jgi:hypothetical protein
MSDAEKPIFPPTEQPNLTQKKVIDTNAAPAGTETPGSVPAPAGTETPGSVPAPAGTETPESVPAPAGAGSPAEGATQKPWYQFWGGKRKSRKQSRKQKGGKKSKSRGGNKKSRKQKRSAKNKRA